MSDKPNAGGFGTPPDACAGLWLTEDATRAMRIVRAPDGSICVSVWRRRGLVAYLVERPAAWQAPVPAAARTANARKRVGYLMVEVGEPGLGSTYDLMVACRVDDREANGGFEWGPVPPGTPREQVRIFPEGGASFYEAVLGYYDDFVEDIRAGDCWMEPLSTWRPATCDEELAEPAPPALSS